MARSNTENDLTAQLAKTLNKVADENQHTLNGTDDPMTMTAAVLMQHGFYIWGVGENKKLGIETCGPYVLIRSHKKEERILERYGDAYKLSSDELKKRNRELTIVNLHERQRLLDLLGEFYSKRTVPIYVRLVVSDLAVGSSLLKSQGSDVMALPENESHRANWLTQARTEMADFTRFLVSKLEAEK